MVIIFKFCINVIIFYYSKIICSLMELNRLAFREQFDFQVFHCLNKFGNHCRVKNQNLSTTPGIKSTLIRNCVLCFIFVVSVGGCSSTGFGAVVL